VPGWPHAERIARAAQASVALDHLPPSQCKGRIAAMLAPIYPPGTGIFVPASATTTGHGRCSTAFS